MDKSLRAEVVRRAGNRCEYCRLPQELRQGQDALNEKVIRLLHAMIDADPNLGAQARKK